MQTLFLWGKKSVSGIKRVLFRCGDAFGFSCHTKKCAFRWLTGFFDIMTSCNPHSRGFKAPLGSLNWSQRGGILMRSREYLISLWFLMKDGTPLHWSKRSFKIVSVGVMSPRHITGTYTLFCLIGWMFCSNPVGVHCFYFVRTPLSLV